MSSLGSALQIGASGLLNYQTAIEVTGNNLANVATSGYTRQMVNLAPAGSQQVAQGAFVGLGVQLQSISSAVDEALNGRVNASISDQSAASARQGVLTQVQSAEGELSTSGSDVSTQLANFFNAWSQLANTPQDTSQRSMVIQQGQTLAGTLQNLAGSLGEQQTQLNQTIASTVSTVNGLLGQLQTVNGQLAATGAGAQNANNLIDQRDQLVAQLAQYVDVSTRQLPTGAVDVFVGSTPLMLDGQSRGLALTQTTVDGQAQTQVVVAADGTPLQAGSGKLGALIAANSQDLGGAIQAVNNFAGQLINQVNLVYSQGQGQTGFSSVTSTNAVADATKALNDPAAGLAFTPQNGSFQVSVTQASTGQTVTSTIDVTLDGVNPASQTTLNSLAASLNAVSGIQASVSADGHLQINGATSDDTITFGKDSSGALAALGVNTFFSGTSASTIAVNSVLSTTPALLAAGQNNNTGDNSNALAVAALNTQALPALGGTSLTGLWGQHVEDYASRLAQATNQVAAAAVVNQSLTAQQQSVSGVNVDTETINLMAFERAYEASARFLSTVDEITKTLLGLS
jgi:flagellar hook-associated protein 1 FlgK